MSRYAWLLFAACSFDHGKDPGTIPGEVDDASIDADIAIDDAVDAPRSNACPASYTLSVSGSKYRVIAAALAFSDQHKDCNDDKAGATHLASLETEGEMLALQAAVFAVATGQYYIGAVQQPNQATTTMGWFGFTGGALPGGHWGNANDDNPGENNEENIGSIDTTDLMHDVTGDLPYPAICECDGLAIDPTVASYLP